jgi:hypothetical protein
MVFFIYWQTFRLLLQKRLPVFKKQLGKQKMINSHNVVVVVYFTVNVITNIKAECNRC